MVTNLELFLKKSKMDINHTVTISGLLKYSLPLKSKLGMVKLATSNLLQLGVALALKRVAATQLEWYVFL